MNPCFAIVSGFDCLDFVCVVPVDPMVLYIIRSARSGPSVAGVRIVSPDVGLVLAVGKIAVNIIAMMAKIVISPRVRVVLVDCVFEVLCSYCLCCLLV